MIASLYLPYLPRLLFYLSALLLGCALITFAGGGMLLTDPAFHHLSPLQFGMLFLLMVVGMFIGASQAPPLRSQNSISSSLCGGPASGRGVAFTVCMDQAAFASPGRAKLYAQRRAVMSGRRGRIFVCGPPHLYSALFSLDNTLCMADRLSVFWSGLQCSAAFFGRCYGQGSVVGRSPDSGAAVSDNGRLIFTLAAVRAASRNHLGDRCRRKAGIPRLLERH